MSKDKRQLIFVWNYLTWGGAQIYFIGIMKIARADWDITVFLPRGSDPKLLGFLDREDIQYEFLENHIDMDPAPLIWRKLERRFSLIRSDVEVFNRLRRFDLSSSILHIEAAPWQSGMLLTALAARRANIFVTFHNALPDAGVVREILWKIRIGIVSRLPRFHVFTSNHDTKDRFRRWVGDSFWETIKVTYTTVNPPEIDTVLDSAPSRAEIRLKFGIGGERFVVLCLGQFIDRKGRWDFLEAAKKVCTIRDDVDLIWMTSTPLTGADHDRIKSFDLGDRFKIVEAEKVGERREDVLSFYKIADVYALPSLVEGLPIALLEAMAMGLASISTNVYAIPEAVKHGQTGLLIEPGRPNMLADAIVRLRDNDELRAKLAAAGREFVIANFDERMASQIAIEAYLECFGACDPQVD